MGTEEELGLIFPPKEFTLSRDPGAGLDGDRPALSPLHLFLKGQSTDWPQLSYVINPQPAQERTFLYLRGWGHSMHEVTLGALLN